MCSEIFIVSRKFQSTLLQEERLFLTFNCCNSILFQSTLLQEERRYQIGIRLYYGDFNPRSYKRSDGKFDFMLTLYEISIHAPTRGATVIMMHLVIISNDFNPRSYKRSDNAINNSSGAASISIHAPTRGATAKMHNNPYTYL